MSGTDRRFGFKSEVAIKGPCVCATTANITLSGTQTIDDVAVVSGDRVLVKDQTDGIENGIYVASATAWARAVDFDGNREVVKGTLVYVHSGTSNIGTWRVTTADDITVDTDSISFSASPLGTTVSAFMATVLNDATSGAALATFGIPIISVTQPEYGAIGDGVTDDSTAIQAALDAVPSGGAIVYFPPAVYRIAATTNLAVKSKTTIFGYGATIDQDVAGVTASASGALEIVGTAVSHKANVTVLGLTITGNATVLVLYNVGILLDYVDNIVLRDVSTTAFGTWGIFVGSNYAEDVRIIDPVVSDIWGDGIHVDGTCNNIRVVRPTVLDSYDDGIGITKGPTNVFIVEPYINGTTIGAGLDLAGCSDVFVDQPAISGYGQHGIRIITNTGTDTYRITINAPDIGAPTGTNQCINIASPNLVSPGHITINNPVLKAGVGLALYVSNAVDVHVNDPRIETTGDGIQFDSASTNNVFINRPTFKGCSTAIKETVAASVGRIEIIDPNFIGVTTHVDNPTYPTRVGPKQRLELDFFKAAAYTTAIVTPAEADTTTRIKKLSAGTRVELVDYASDAGGGGDAVIELYDYTNSAVLLTHTIAGGGAAAWRSGGTVMIPTDIEVGVRFYRSFAGPVFTLNSAALLVY